MLLKWGAKNTRSYGSLYSTDFLLLSYFCNFFYLFMTTGTHIMFTGTYNNVNMYCIYPNRSLAIYFL